MPPCPSLGGMRLSLESCASHLQGLLLLSARRGHQQVAVGLDLLRGGRRTPPRLRRRPHLQQTTVASADRR
jgi:hypothetical protein